MEQDEIRVRGGDPAEQQGGQSAAEHKVEDLYKNDVDRQLWAPAPLDFGGSSFTPRRRLRRWMQAVRSMFLRLFSVR